MKPKPARHVWWKAAAATAGLLLAYWALLCFPQVCFAAQVTDGSLTLYSDRPFAAEAGRQVLERAQAKLATSPLYRPAQTQRIFICNARWRQLLFMRDNYRVGGLNQYPFTPNIFIREANVEGDQVIGPSGRPADGPRTLAFFIAHELTHTLTIQHTGLLAYRRLPQWIREGYADYVALGAPLDYEQARQQFLAGAPDMDFQRSGKYLRFHFLVATLLDRQHWSVERLLREHPTQASVEALAAAD